MKKILKACVVMAAFAAVFVVPSIASAAKATVTSPTGVTPAPTHASPLAITGNNVGNTVMTNSSKEALVTCATAKMEGNLETNTHAAIEGTITAASFFGKPGNHASTECEGSIGATTVTTNPATNGLPWCLRSTEAMGADEFQVRGGGCTSASRPIRFTLHVTTIFGTISCTYQKGTAIIGKYTTHPLSTSPTVMSISAVGFPLLEGGFGCPGEGFLDMSFALSSGANGVFIDKV
jgi:hypothetical protein